MKGRNSSGSLEEGRVGADFFYMEDQPLDGETVTIGSDVYSFVSAVGDEVLVELGATVWETLEALVTAINTLGTESVFATLHHAVVATVPFDVLILQQATKVGGTPKADFAPEIETSTTIALGATWYDGLVDTGAPALDRKHTHVAVGQADVATNGIFGWAPFVIKAWDFQIYHDDAVVVRTASFRLVTIDGADTGFSISGLDLLEGDRFVIHLYGSTR
jgi:hypothetical protein